MKQKFKVGDRVRITGGYDNSFNGQCGVITRPYEKKWMVQWVPGTHEHSRGHYSFREDEIELIQDGLVHGDACKEYTPAQLRYALERAGELGVLSENQHSDGGWLFYGGTSSYKDGVTTAGMVGSHWSKESKNFMSFSEFMEKMERTPKREEPPMIGSYKAEIKDGKLAFGCQTISGDVLENLVKEIKRGWITTDQGERVAVYRSDDKVRVMGNDIKFAQVIKVYEWFNKQTK